MASNYPPKKNVAFTMYFFIFKNDGTLIANPTLTGSNVHVDGSTTEVTNSTLAVVDSTTGLCSIALAQATMNGDQIDGTITSSSTGAVVYPFKILTSAYTNDEIGADLAAVHVHASNADTKTAGLAFTTANQVDARVLTALDSSGVTEILTRVPDATAGTASGLAIVGSKMDLVDAPNATGISAIVTAINGLAIYGLTALNTLLVTTGIKAASIPAVTDATLSIAYDHAKDDTLGAIGALNDFDHTTDVVAHVTLVDTTTTNTDMVSVSGLSTFAPATDVVAHVTLVDTTTINTDMVSEPPTMVDISDLPTNSELGLAIAALATVQAAPDISGLSTFDPALDIVAHVTLVDTTTTNTDMVAAAPSIADLPTNSELGIAIADLAHVDAAPDISGLSTFNPAIDTVTLGVAYNHAKDDVLTGIAGLATVAAAPDISGLATKTEVLALSPVTAAADPADVAALILATPIYKIVTNVDGSVNADASVDTGAIASDVVDALTVAGIPTLGVIEASTVLAMKADVAAIQAPTFSGTVTFDGTVDASVDMTPITEAISAIPAPTFDGTVTFSGTVSAPSVTVNPTVLSIGERAAIAAATDSVITANHGTGIYGGATLAAGVVITPATFGTDGTALGRVMPYGRVTVYHGDEAQYVFNADADGDYSYELPVGSVWTLVARRSGYQDTEAAVSTEDAVS